jgi:hypothetical protein
MLSGVLRPATQPSIECPVVWGRRDGCTPFHTLRQALKPCTSPTRVQLSLPYFAPLSLTAHLCPLLALPFISPLPPSNPTHPRPCEDLIPSSFQSFELRPVDSEGQGAFPVDSEVCGLPLSVPGEEDRSHGRHLGLSSATLRGQPRQFAIRRPPDDDAHDCPCLGEIQRKGQQTTHPKW